MAGYLNNRHDRRVKEGCRGDVVSADAQARRRFLVGRWALGEAQPCACLVSAVSAAAVCPSTRPTLLFSFLLFCFALYTFNIPSSLPTFASGVTVSLYPPLRPAHIPPASRPRSPISHPHPIATATPSITGLRARLHHPSIGWHSNSYGPPHVDRRV